MTILDQDDKIILTLPSSYYRQISSGRFFRQCQLGRHLEESEPSRYAKLSGSTLFDLKPGTLKPLEGFGQVKRVNRTSLAGEDLSIPAKVESPPRVSRKSVRGYGRGYRAWLQQKRSTVSKQL